MKQGYVIIGFWIVLLSAGFFIVRASLLEEQESSKSQIVEQTTVSYLPLEEGVFKLSHNAMDYLQQEGLAAESNKAMSSYYHQRAFSGAPPTIPHPVTEKQNMGDKDCLQCHQDGGYVDKYKAYTPITPHPEFINCKQCHVSATTSSMFKPNNWSLSSPPETNQRALPGSPPIIPHDLEMRNNCLACHAGPAAPKKIRVSHPNRVNCLQCHTLKDNFLKTSDEWIRK